MDTRKPESGRISVKVINYLGDEVMKYIGGIMKTDLEVRAEGMSILLKYMDVLEAERFISIIQSEKFDYTKWRQNLWKDLSVREISKLAMENLEEKRK